MKFIKNKKDLINLRKKFKKKKIGLCHGVFDILHFGHLEHFTEAKKNCEILLVSLTSDEFVKKGPNQPYNSDVKRAAIIQSLEICDYVYINNSPIANDVIRDLKPNVDFKGQDYLEGGLKIKRVHKINSIAFFKLKCRIIIDIKTDIIV